MKKNLRTIATSVLVCLACSLSAQQVTTLYFLENAPMRHTINPAFQPVSNGYLNLPALGYTNFWFGNNALTLSDLIFRNEAGTVVTPFHPSVPTDQFMNGLPDQLLIDGQINLSLLNLGFRIKQKGYITLGINQHINFGLGLPKGLFSFFTTAPANPDQPQLDLTGLALDANTYTEIAAGYSHQINDMWTVGGKLKVLLGEAYIGMQNEHLGIDMSTEAVRLHGQSNIMLASPINMDAIPDRITDRDSWQMDQLLPSLNDLLKPAGMGAAVDLGFTCKPIEHLQISAAVVDLGLIRWKGYDLGCAVDTTFTGVGDLEYSDLMQDGQFNTQQLLDSALQNMSGLLSNVQATRNYAGFTTMPTARFNIGVDANFWDNRVGVGIVSSTRLYNKKVYEELTLGVSFRPFNWLNLAASYSLLNNGKFSNIGAGLSLMPYDGINLTLAMDYIPTTYAGISEELSMAIPYKSKGVNASLGLSIVWGTNHKKAKVTDKNAL